MIIGKSLTALGGGGLEPEIRVTAKAGALLNLHYKGSSIILQSYQLGASETTHTFVVNVSETAYVIEDSTNRKSVEVLVDVVAQYSVEIHYILWLYKDGDDFEDVTGGWNVTYFGSSYYSVATKNNGNIYMKNIDNNDYQPYMSTNKKINTIGYSKICLVADAYRYTSAPSSPGYVTLEFKETNTRNSYYFGSPVLFDQNVSYTDKIFSWNISSENNYLLFGTTMNNANGYAEITIKKIWLE